MSTAAQRAANRANAQKSTGPQTSEGKAQSSLNNFRHGLRGAFRLLPTESAEEFDALLNGLRNDHKPATETEELLVQQMAEHVWLSRRARNFQHLMFDQPETYTFRSMNMWMRYENQHHRAFQQSLNALLKLRAERRKDEIGFERNKREQEAHDVKQRISQARAEAQEAKNGVQKSRRPATPTAQNARTTPPSLSASSENNKMAA